MCAPRDPQSPACLGPACLGLDCNRRQRKIFTPTLRVVLRRHLLRRRPGFSHTALLQILFRLLHSLHLLKQIIFHVGLGRSVSRRDSLYILGAVLGDSGG